MGQFNIHPINLIKALSWAVELSRQGRHNHHWHTAYICAKIAHEYGMTPRKQQKVVHAALLHDIGTAIIKPDEQSANVSEAVGGSFLQKSRKLKYLADIIAKHKENWNYGKNAVEIPIGARILHIADYVEVILRNIDNPLLEQDKIVETIKNRGSQYFEPDVLHAFCKAANADGFWLDLMTDSYRETFFAELKSYGTETYYLDDVIDIAEIFAGIIDGTSRFTGKHSRSVAKTAVFLAGKIGFSEDELKEMRIAGLLHDLGKLAVGNQILEKKDKLSNDEIRLIHQHPYYTYRILQTIDNFDKIAEWAAFHHETLDGAGYPFKFCANQITIGSRIMAAADVFVALTENRPYRPGMPQEKVIKILKEMVQNQKLDGVIVELILQQQENLAKLVKK